MKKIKSERILVVFKNKQKYTSLEQIVIVNRLRSEDLLLQTTTQEIKKALEKDIRWVLEIYNSIVVVRKSFLVMIHEIRVSKFDIDN